MTVGVIKNKSLVAAVKEVTEGVPVAPTLVSQFAQVLEGISVEPAKELVEREVLTPEKGRIQPRTSLRSATASVPIEWKASGTEGAADLESSIYYESLMGSLRNIAVRDTIEATSTVSNFLITGHSYQKGDFLHILEPGAHHLAFVQEVVDVDNITITPPMPAVPTAGTEIAEFTVYSSGDPEPTFTLSTYWGDEINMETAGNRPSACSFENITTGQTPQANFTLAALDYDQRDESAPVVPVFNDSVPPLALNMTVAKDGVCFDMDELSFNVENEISQLTSVKSASGIISTRIVKRSVGGNITPYMDDASLEFFNNFNDNDNFEIVIAAANPSAVDGEFILGSAVGAYMPQCIFTSFGTADKDGALTNAMDFQAHAGSTGSEKELFLGFS